MHQLVLFVGLHLLLFVFKSFFQRKISKFSLFYYLFLIRKSDLSSCKIFILYHHVRYSQFCLVIKAGIFSASLLISYCILPSLIWSSIVITYLFDIYIFVLKIYSKRFFLNLKRLSDGKVVSLTKVNIWWMIYCNLLKFPFIGNFQNKKVRSIKSNFFWYFKTWLCTTEMFNFLPLISNSIIIGFYFCY